MGQCLYYNCTSACFIHTALLGLLVTIKVYYGIVLGALTELKRKYICDLSHLQTLNDINKPFEYNMPSSPT